MLTAEILVALYRSGWEPMTPIDLSVKGKAQNQTAICFRRDSPEDEYVHGEHATGSKIRICFRTLIMLITDITVQVNVIKGRMRVVFFTQPLAKFLWTAEYV